MTARIQPFFVCVVFKGDGTFNYFINYAKGDLSPLAVSKGEQEMF
jgi:hypothetical protein